MIGKAVRIVPARLLVMAYHRHHLSGCAGCRAASVVSVARDVTEMSDRPSARCLSIAMESSIRRMTGLRQMTGMAGRYHADRCTQGVLTRWQPIATSHRPPRTTRGDDLLESLRPQLPSETVAKQMDRMLEPGEDLQQRVSAHLPPDTLPVPEVHVGTLATMAELKAAAEKQVAATRAQYDDLQNAMARLPGLIDRAPASG